ncbi:hypothetical protein GCM10023215_13350 [Pseudonocardia yuanmonensis]|uniref:Uncharacterized protein n=1 Tax=Pseudonocardia yuanmonensis TaxID=1095914 RepID=A0ABP8W7G1_9PSEU
MSSVEPSSTTTYSKRASLCRLTESMASPIHRPTLYAGVITETTAAFFGTNRTLSMAREYRSRAPIHSFGSCADE